MVAQVYRSEALGELPEQNERMQERVNARIGKAQARGPLMPGGDWAIDGLEAIFTDDAIVAQPLDLEQPAIGHKPDLAQLGQIVQAPADPEVVSVVDGCFRAQRPILLVILFDARVLVIDVQGWGHIVGHDPGAQPRSGIAQYPTIEDELDLLGAA